MVEAGLPPIADTLKTDLGQAPEDLAEVDALHPQAEEAVQCLEEDLEEEAPCTEVAQEEEVPRDPDEAILRIEVEDDLALWIDRLRLTLQVRDV